MGSWTNLFSAKNTPETKPTYQSLVSEEFMDAIQNGNRDEVLRLLRLIPLLGDLEFLKKGLALSKKTRWHAFLQKF